mmetsp:Transcript_111906/g.216862  ORF Transcript_111906/g.216862 Transcript_111906/m.216862 type:complete len:84 (-) Transcript_111906:1268-1519(-)
MLGPLLQAYDSVTVHAETTLPDRQVARRLDKQHMARGGEGQQLTPPVALHPSNSRNTKKMATPRASCTFREPTSMTGFLSWDP